MTERTYLMGEERERVPESGMQAWHNRRGLPWGRTFNGLLPKTISRMARSVLFNIPVHLGNEHGIRTEGIPYEQLHIRHMMAHVYGEFRDGQEHYHERPKEASHAQRAH